MKVIITKDGSSTVQLEDSGLTYHSKHGAIQESKHVFIESGLNYYIDTFPNNTIHIFEMGFGTGLNCLLTFEAIKKLPTTIFYTALELHPLIAPVYQVLNFSDKENLPHHAHTFRMMHEAEWNQPIALSPQFHLTKLRSDIRTYLPSERFDLVYFDAFAPDANPDQWSPQVFKTLYNSLNENGVLVTYSSKVIVRRALEAAGFLVQKIPGPRGKREIVRALKYA